MNEIVYHKPKQLNLNSLFVALVGFICIEAYRETRATHDAVLNYGIQITELRARVTDVESRQAATDLEIIKLKQKLGLNQP